MFRADVEVEAYAGPDPLPVPDVDVDVEALGAEGRGALGGAAFVPPG